MFYYHYRDDVPRLSRENVESLKRAVAELSSILDNSDLFRNVREVEGSTLRNPAIDFKTMKDRGEFDYLEDEQYAEALDAVNQAAGLYGHHSRIKVSEGILDNEFVKLAEVRRALVHLLHFAQVTDALDCYYDKMDEIAKLSQDADADTTDTREFAYKAMDEDAPIEEDASDEYEDVPSDETPSGSSFDFFFDDSFSFAPVDDDFDI